VPVEENCPASKMSPVRHGTHIIFALLGGAVFNVANLLLVATIDIAGLGVAFSIGIGLALVVGVLLNYFISPQGSPLLLFGGVNFERPGQSPYLYYTPFNGGLNRDLLRVRVTITAH
jgi:hypothetical protein